MPHSQLVVVFPNLVAYWTAVGSLRAASTRVVNAARFAGDRFCSVCSAGSGVDRGVHEAKGLAGLSVPLPSQVLRGEGA